MNEARDCWIGPCAGRSRTLISATWSLGNRGREAAAAGYYRDHPVFCTKRCRIANAHRVPKYASAARKRARRANGTA